MQNVSVVLNATNLTGEVICPVSQQATELCNSLLASIAWRMSAMVMINFLAVMGLMAGDRLRMRGKMDLKTWEKWVFIPCMVALIISSVWLMEVVLNGIY